jgi:hypothetical protein
MDEEEKSKKRRKGEEGENQPSPFQISYEPICGLYNRRFEAKYSK